MEQLVYRVIIPICRILPILAVSLKMLLMSKELYIIGFTLIFRILRCTFHMLSFKGFTVFVVGFTSVDNILLLFFSPISCTFTL